MVELSTSVAVRAGVDQASAVHSDVIYPCKEGVLVRLRKGRRCVESLI